MRVIEEGHVYELNSIDAPNGLKTQVLTFCNREPGHEHPGTQTQEAIRVAIDRTMHCDNCLRWEGNDLIIYHLRMALVLHEARALIRKVEKGYIMPENIETDPRDGHFLLSKLPNSDDSTEYENKAKPDSPLVKKMPDFCRKKAANG